ncbi:hypothetical protein CONPUDRAFT_82649 [Coniophora puteana RWD-64-598 SS2]|uniref:Uncharacterized protein n=1 Tax=Coniophora puteana (strain RWD-64-598) TaxID=741705 RepID=A0A5M3MMQ7_CONPW|nr:uncharacterized protein CONPUDRAFT_82649 [Coniophora puteana RWD-64-598 SS2]EIW80393.1 hypothetical protein CONPUDRAFT_82649 [Coniophora puteana RWD-64-598 SS2]
MLMTSLTVSSVMMLKRVKALYQSTPLVTYILFLVLAIWLGVTLADATKPTRALHSPVVHVCMVNIDPQKQSRKLETRLTSFLIYIAFDTLVFLLTLARALPFQPFTNRDTIARKLAADGLLWYAFITFVNIAHTIMMVRAPPGIENVLGETAFLLQVTMTSRITLSLPKTYRKLTSIDTRWGSRWENYPPIVFAS